MRYGMFSIINQEPKKLGDEIMFHKCKISVVERRVNKGVAGSYLKNPDNVAVCNKVADNQEFTISNPFEMPEGICPWAWADIRPFILTIASGGEFEMMKDKNSALAVCSDLFRPVIFKIERIDD